MRIVPIFMSVVCATSALADDHSTFNWRVVDANGDVVWETDHTDNRPSVRYTEPGMWQVKSGLGEMRVTGNGMPDDGFGATEDLDARNTFAHIQVPIAGVMKKVGCDPDFDDPKGDMIRDRLDSDRVSGRFNVTLIGCDDYFTGEPVDVPNLPYTLRGEVDLARK